MTVAIYCRLSREDLVPGISGDRQEESESIQNQKSLLIRYALEQAWDIVDIYTDEDYSGIDSERPAFRRLLADAEARRFNIVLCKTQSRFTRDMELVERYLHHRFVEWGIRFVAVVDHVDTEISGNKKARQINGLINEWYLEDLSENIRAVFDHKRRQGQYIGGFPLYGYVRHPEDKHRLVVEPQAAEVVRQIFRLYLGGKGKQAIAAALNAAGIPNPTKHKQQLGMGYVNAFAANDYGLWNRTSVGRILRERMYTGALIQGKRRKPTYKSKCAVAVPEERWYVTENAHEAIIDRAMFDTVQQMLDARTRSDGTGEVHPLGGKVRCMECGSTMAKASHTTKQGCNAYLRCKLHATDQSRCAKNVISLALLEQQILVLVKQQIDLWFDRASLEQIAAEECPRPHLAALGAEAAELQKKLAQRDKALRELYLDKSAGLIDKAQFLELNAGYLAEREQYQRRLAALENERAAQAACVHSSAERRALLEQYLAPETLTRELAVELVDFIEVGKLDPATNTRSIHIHWLF